MYKVHLQSFPRHIPITQIELILPWNLQSTMFLVKYFDLQIYNFYTENLVDCRQVFGRFKKLSICRSKYFGQLFWSMCVFGMFLGICFNENSVNVLYTFQDNKKPMTLSKKTFIGLKSDQFWMKIEKSFNIFVDCRFKNLYGYM